TVDEICEEAGVTKGCFFHYFDDKDQLAKETLAYYCEGRAEQMKNAPFRKLSDPLERVYGRLDAFEAAMKDPKAPKGCLMGIFTQELATESPEMRKQCEAMFVGGAKDFELDIAEAKKKYAPNADFKPGEVARFFIS